MIAGSRSRKGYANEAATIPIPVPYLLAAMCASKSVPLHRASRNLGQRGESVNQLLGPIFWIMKSRWTGHAALRLN